MDEAGHIDEVWLDVFREFPERFVIGGDQIIVGELPANAPAAEFARHAAQRRALTARFLASLPADLGARIGHENALRLYASIRNSGRDPAEVVGCPPNRKCPDAATYQSHRPVTPFRPPGSRRLRCFGPGGGPWRNAIAVIGRAYLDAEQSLGSSVWRRGSRITAMDPARRVECCSQTGRH